MTPARVQIRGGRLLDPASGRDGPADLWITDGKIAAIDSPPPDPAVDETIDATGHWILPGLVDIRVHLREPGQERKGDIRSEVNAAAAGGITLVCCQPDTDPVVDTPAVVELIHERAEFANRAHVVTLGALTLGLKGRFLSEMAALRASGCLGVSNGPYPVSNTEVMRRALEYAATFDLPVFISPVDPDLAGQGCVHEGETGTRLGLPGIPAAAETVALARDLALVEQTGARVHFGPLSTARGGAMIRAAQLQGLPVTASTAIHHLVLTEADVAEFNTDCHVSPPLRRAEDRDELLRLVADGTLSAITSDHQPHEADAKQGPFVETEPGISGFETLLSLALSLVHAERLDPLTAVHRLTHGPARILGIESAGQIRVGDQADLCIVDPFATWIVDRNRLRSRGHNTPFDGARLSGRIRQTFIKGRSVYRSD